MSIVFQVIVAILVFGLLIFVHELGHFTVGKLSGMRVNEFALGMGPVPVSYTHLDVYKRQGHNSAKWDRRFIGEGKDALLPFWVADTDFRTLPEVNAALAKCVEHGIYGYTLPPEGCAAAAARWQKGRHEFEIQEEWVTFLAGIDCAISTAVQAFTQPGDEVLINTPIYTPFFEVVLENGRQVVSSPMRLVDGKRCV